MEAQMAQFANRGMYQDTSISKASNEFAFYNYNIRITAINDNTLLSVTNEILPKELDHLTGVYVGHAIANDYLIVFTKSETNDYIFKIIINEDKVEGSILFEGDLGFYSNNIESIETLFYYESEDIQKVYWVDGIHETRFINVVSTEKITDSNILSFNPTIKVFPTCTITKNYNGVGMFPSGVIQYFISCYNKYGAETGIIWASDLQYITEYNKGEAPDKTVNCSFTLNIDFTEKDVLPNFEYVKVFSLYRTSYNGEVVAQLVSDSKLYANMTITDTNLNNEIIDPTSLYFLGGNKFIAKTLAQKDNTLFLGGIETKAEVVPDSIKTIIKNRLEEYKDSEGRYISPYITFTSKVIGKPSEDIAEEFQLNKSEEDVKTFKYGELYRFGVQFQTDSGSWTEPIWIGDSICNVKPSLNDKGEITVATAELNLTVDIEATPYVNYRLLIAEPTNADRSILAQGIVSPTMFRFNDRVHGDGAYAMSSWIMRPRNGVAAFDHLTSVGNKAYKSDNSYNIWENLKSCELQNSINKIPIMNEGEFKKGLILSFYYRKEGVLYYHAYLGNNPTNNVSAITESNIEEMIYSNSTPMADPKNYYAVTETFKTVLKDIQTNIADVIKYPMELENADTLGNYFANIFSQDPSLTGMDYRGVYKNMPDYKYSSGYFDSHDSGILKTYNNAEDYGCYGYAQSTLKSSDIDGFETNFYVDSSILTFHSPEIEANESLFTDTELSFDIVGLVPIDNFISDINLSVDQPTKSGKGHLVKPTNVNKEALLNAPMFDDDLRYYLYLWNKSNSVIGQTANWQSEEKYSYLKSKKIANKNFSLNSRYDLNVSSSVDEWSPIIVKPLVFNSDQVVTKLLAVNNNTEYYQGNYDSIIPSVAENLDAGIFSYRVFYKTDRYTEADYKSEDVQSDPVRIKYKSTPHIAFSLGINILPYLYHNGEASWEEALFSFYDTPSSSIQGNKGFPWLDGVSIHSSYDQKYIKGIQENKPYFYLAELKRNIDYNVLYGGTDNNALEVLNWIPASKAYKIGVPINKSFGDTYYQRWDCLKTYPFTTEDENSVIDITSFMVETHINLLGRYDSHKVMDDIINVNNTNFAQINDVYSQSNNFFSYNVLDEKFANTKHSTQITYSLNKVPTADVDLWTSITLSSAFNLDGSKGKLHKIINLNDTLIAFQDKAISTINFNNRTALSTEGGVPIEIANSGKVDGYSIIIDNIGCQNKQSICIASSGVYFIDDRNKTLFNFNKEGLTNISSKGMSMWFKNNLTSKEKVHYDYLTHDIYITNDTKCLNYNEDLQSFVSFFDYKDTDALINLNKGSYLLKGTSIKEMFKGDYAYDYCIQHKINPEPLADKVFTNIEYISDCYDKSVDSSKSFGESADKILPFNKLKVWNEYQEGETTLQKKYPTFNKKFRIWRVDVPRDKHSLRDRIRNPWMMLELSNNKEHNNRMVFHNLLVKYYK